MAPTGQRLSLVFLIMMAVVVSLFVVETRPSDGSAPSGDVVPSWRKYFRNDSLTGSVVPCSPQEHFCLQRGLLLHPESGKCYLWGKSQPCVETDEIFRVDKQHFLTSGHVRGACVKRKLCSDRNEFRMAADSSCIFMAEVSLMCFGEEGVGVSENFFGETECACTYGTSCTVPQSTPTSHGNTSSLHLPREVAPEGQCVVPDLRDPQLIPAHSASDYFRLLTPRSQVPCTEDEHRCFLQGKIYSEAHHRCYSLWERGPCEEGEWFALDRDEAVNGSGRLTGACRRLPCPAGHVSAVASALYPKGSCVTPAELCGGAYPVVFDAEGNAACWWSGGVEPLRMPTERIPAEEEDDSPLCRFPGMQVGNIPYRPSTPLRQRA